MCENVLKCADADICEKRETLDVTVLIRRVLGHHHIALTDCLALDTVCGLFLGVFTDDPHNRAAVKGGDQVAKSSPKLHRPSGKSYTSPSSFPYP
jgi:hypothetical protein